MPLTVKKKEPPPILNIVSPNPIPVPVLPTPEKIPLKIPPPAYTDPYNVNLSGINVANKSATGEAGYKKVEVTMDIVPHPNKKFMARYHRYEPAVKDSTAIKTLKECARKYFYHIVLGRVSRESAVIFAWGSAYHTFREVLEKEYGYGPERPKTFDERRGAECFVKAYRAGMAYWDQHGKDQEEGTQYAFMNKGRLTLSFKTAYQHWVLEKKQNQIVVIAVESPLIVQLSDGSYTGGKADQIIKWRGQKWGRDWKTTTIEPKYYTRGLEPNDQFTRYTLMESLVTGEQIQGQVIEVLYNNNHTKNVKKGPEIHTFTTARTVQQLEAFEQEQIHWNRILELHREHDNWPMEEHSCWRCVYHSVCKKPTESGMMSQLEQYFIVRPWDFTKIGEE